MAALGAVTTLAAVNAVESAPYTVGGREREGERLATPVNSSLRGASSASAVCEAIRRWG